MQNTLKAALVLGVLMLGGAQAASATTSSYASATASAQVQSAVLLNAQGQAVGTISQAGQVMASGALETATQVRVMFAGGLSKTYALASRLGAGARATADVLVVRSGNSMLSLGSAIRADVQARTEAGLRAAQALNGKTVTLIGAQGQVIGTFLADGTVRLSGDLRQATDVVVSLSNGQKVTYDLAAQVMAAADGSVSLSSVTVSEQGRSVALTSVLGRLSGSVTTTGGQAGGSAGAAGGSVSVGGSASGSAGGETSVGTTPGSGSAGGGISIGIGVGVGIGVGGK
ncbi:hypothetical protein [Deinococcus hohokamensis]|uniref:DUF5666 domain-containing protein n=1 Tax=Deinococcus hohokamensis TaxID=309883 RepID=A0ABV9IAU3_9DEIO